MELLKPILAHVLLSMAMGEEKVESFFVQVDDLYENKNENTKTIDEYIGLDDLKQAQIQLNLARRQFSEKGKEQTSIRIVVFGTDDEFQTFQSRNFGCSLQRQIYCSI